MFSQLFWDFSVNIHSIQFHCFHFRPEFFFFFPFNFIIFLVLYFLLTSFVDSSLHFLSGKFFISLKGNEVLRFQWVSLCKVSVHFPALCFIPFHSISLFLLHARIFFFFTLTFKQAWDCGWSAHPHARP